MEPLSKYVEGEFFCLVGEMLFLNMCTYHMENMNLLFLVYRSEKLGIKNWLSLKNIYSLLREYFIF